MIDDQFKAIFLEEASELLDNLEEALLALEETPSNTEAIGEVFRVMHTFKGNSKMFGLEKIGEITHHLETLYDLIRQGRLDLKPDLLSTTFLVLDHLKACLNDPQLTHSTHASTHTALTLTLLDLIGETEEASDIAPSHAPDTVSAKTDTPPLCSTYFVFFKLTSDTFVKGTNPLYVADELASMGDCLAFPNVDEVPELAQYDPEQCYTYWNTFLATEQSVDAIRDVFMFVEDHSEIDIQFLSEGNLVRQPEFTKRVAELNRNAQKIDVTQVQMIVGELARQTMEKADTDAPANPQPTTPAKEQVISSIRVSSEKLDGLLNRVSELITSQAQLSLLAQQQASPELQSVAENMEKLIRQLRDNAFSICLVPIETMITRFRRMVRDLARQLGKDVRFATEGTDTEMDKIIIERLSDPLMHLLRNCLDHGIESQTQRTEKGKVPQGTILFKTFYSGTNVHIQIQDDGAGIDPQKIRAKAVAQGLIREDEPLSAREVFDLLFLPGFSTARQVSDISGRGVGMDVVKRNITDLRGEIVIDSQVDVGTTMTIKLPLTLSVVDGLLVKIHTTHFVIPLSAVQKCYEVPRQQLAGSFNQLVVLEGEQLPYCYLRDEFAIRDEPTDLEQVIVVEYDQRLVGLVVDTVVGEYQAVLKPLGRLYKNQQMISGATILGNGTIALVLDTDKIVKEVLVKLKEEKIACESI